MPSYAKVLTDTYLPAQAAKLRWESAKTVAGAQFDALEAERKALAEVRAARTRYAENLRPRENNDAFVMAALSGVVKAEGELGAASAGGFVYSNPAFDEAMVKARQAADKGGAPTPVDVANAVAAAKAAKTTDERNLVDALAKQVGGNAPAKVAEVKRPVKSTAQVKAGKDAASREIRDSLQAGVAGAEGVLEQAQSSGSMGFEGGKGGKDWYDSLGDDQKRMLAIYQSALEDDGVISPGEVPGDEAEAAKLFEEAKLQGGYRRKDRTIYDPSYLQILQEETKAAGRLTEAEARLAGKTKETLAEELYAGASERAAIPPLLRSLEPEMKGFLDGYTGALASDPKTDPEAFLKSKLTDREAKGFSAASAMAASGMRAADIMNNLRALSPEERRKVMGALASRDAIASTQMKVAPGTPLPEIEKIQAEDRRAQEAELARTESRLQRRLREIDESLAAGRESGFGGIVSPDTGARRAPAVSPRREVLMGALSPEEEAAQARLADEAEVARVGARLDQERLERDRLMDTGMAGYDPATELQEPVPTRPIPSRRKTGYEDRAERSRQVAETEQERADLARRVYGQIEDPRDAAAVRGALMQGLEPARSVGPTRADLRPESFEFDQLEPAPVLVPEEVPAPEPVPDRVYKKVFNRATGTVELVEVK